MSKHLPNVYVVQHPYAAYVGITRRIFDDKKDIYNVVDTLDTADIVVWTGGEDIYPALYKEEPIEGIYFSRTRDGFDCLAVDKAFAGKKFLVGICRGGQLLNCYPNDGKLWQDVDHHSGLHGIYDKVLGKTFTVNSYHHQMMRPSEKGNVIAWTEQSTYKIADNGNSRLVWSNNNPSAHGYWDKVDPEVIWYEKTRSLCLQFHPEFGHRETTDYFFNLMDRYFFEQEVMKGAA